jgi:hypothetical protein
MILVPEVKSITYSDGFFPVPSQISVNMTDHLTLHPLLLDEVCHGCYWTGETSDLTISLDPKIDKPSGYRIEINPDKIFLFGKDRLGVIHGLSTLKQLLSESRIACGEIVDHPDLSIRGFMLDISRDMIPSLDTLKNLVRLMWRVKMNHLELYIEGFALELPGFPDLPYDHPLTMIDFDELASFADIYGIDLVPNINTFGHMTEWLKQDQYRHLAESESGYLAFGYPFPPSTLNPSDSESSQLVQKIITPLLEQSRSNLFHLNADEPFELSQGKSRVLCEQKGLGRVYLDFLQPLFSRVEASGKQPIIWGDVLANHPEVLEEFPTSVIVTDWGYDDDHDFFTPAKRYRDHGIPFLLAPGTSSWNSFASRRHDMVQSTIHAIQAAQMYGGLGILTTDWGDFSHPQPFIVSIHGLVFAGACSWSLCQEDADFSEWIDRFGIIGFNGSGIAVILADLAGYSLMEPKHMANQTLLFASWMYVDDDPTHPLEMKAILWKEAVSRHPILPSCTTRIQALIDKTRIAIQGKQSLIYEEVGHVLDFMELALCLNEMVNQNLDRRQKALHLIGHLLDEFDRRWLERNKPHGLAKAKVRLQVLTAFLQNPDLL